MGITVALPDGAALLIATIENGKASFKVQSTDGANQDLVDALGVFAEMEVPIGKEQRRLVRMQRRQARREQRRAERRAARKAARAAGEEVEEESDDDLFVHDDEITDAVIAKEILERAMAVGDAPETKKANGNGKRSRTKKKAAAKS